MVKYRPRSICAKERCSARAGVVATALIARQVKAAAKAAFRRIDHLRPHACTSGPGFLRYCVRDRFGRPVGQRPHACRSGCSRGSAESALAPMTNTLDTSQLLQIAVDRAASGFAAHDRAAGVVGASDRARCRSAPLRVVDLDLARLHRLRDLRQPPDRSR